LKIVFYNSKHRKLRVDESVFMNKGNLYVTYENTWIKPDGQVYKKFTKHKPLGQFAEELPIGSYNSYNHKLLNIETCYLISKRKMMNY